MYIYILATLKRQVIYYSKHLNIYRRDADKGKILADIFIFWHIKYIKAI